MSLLPKCPSRFDKKSFWDSAYKSTDKPFEWYADFEDLLPLFVKYFRLSDRILNVGCGNSDLGSNLCSSGWEHVVNIDISETVISKMKEQYPNHDYQQMDATNMSFEDNSFDAVVDKGTIDALLPSSAALSEESANVVKNLISESLRVLKPMGRFVIVSLAQRHVVETLRSFFEQCATCNCVVRAHHLPSKDKSNAFALPVFVFVAMKMKADRMIPIYELQSRPGSNFDSNMRCSDGTTWAAGVLAHQVVQYNIRTANSRFPPKIHPSEHFDVLLEFDSSKSQIGGFRLFVVDKPGPAAIKFAVFVVPCGREIDELYSSVEGRNNLAVAVSAGRLIVCSVIPKIQSKETIVNELTLSGVTALLNEAVVQFAPPSFIPDTDKAPYLTEAPGTGNQQKLGSLFVKAEGNLLRIIEVEMAIEADCRNSSSSGKRKARKKVDAGMKQFRQLTEAQSNHLCCIARYCLKHAKSGNWNCQQLPSNCALRQLLSDDSCVLQIGDDCKHLSNRVKCSALTVKGWSIFSVQEEFASETVNSEMKVDTANCKMLSTTEQLFGYVKSSTEPSNGSSNSFWVAIVMFSCAFTRSVELFAENVAQLLPENGRLVLMRCCREPTRDLMKLENEIRTAFSSKNQKSAIVEMDITDTMGEWSAAAEESSNGS